jgi:carbon-monoxide dehydrogenase large subunit
MDTSKVEHLQVGQKLLRKEDVRFLTGHGKYIDDIQIPNCWHAAFLRSPYAHAKIISIHTHEAFQLDGVIGVYTGKDSVEITNPLRIAPPIDGLKPIEMTTLPIDKVLFQGDLIACVIAKNRYIAEDALDLIELEVEQLEPITNIATAQKKDAPLVNNSLNTNLLSHQFKEIGNIQSSKENGFKIIESTFSQHRQTHLPMETRGCICYLG